MGTNIFSNPIIGWIAIATGVTAILAVIFLALMYTVKRSFGTVNDYLNSVIGIESAILAWLFYAEHHTQSPLLSQIALALAIIGAIFAIIGSLLSILGVTDFVLAGWYSGFGNALIGLWLVALCYSLTNVGVLPHRLVIFGLVTGSFMVIGLIGIPGMVAGIDRLESMPRYLYVAFFGWLGFYILYPIWLIWLGRYLLLLK